MKASDKSRAPVAHPEMVKIRRNIDALDQKLVALLAQRQKLIEAAGRIKPSRDTIYDQNRIDEVIALIRTHAQTHGLSPQMAETLWQKLIRLSIEHEYKIFDNR